jgi:hypothetical protein
MKPFPGTYETALKHIGLILSHYAAPTAFMQRRLTMRARYAIAVVSAILVGFGLKLFFFSAPSAVADTGVVMSVSMNISEIQKNIKNLPVEKINDMTFVFD